MATATASATLRKTHIGGAGRPQRWVVSVDGADVGYLERYRGGSALPYHAFAGIGRESRHVGMFHPETRFYADGSVLYATGGKEAAIAAVLAVHDES